MQKLAPFEMSDKVCGDTPASVDRSVGVHPFHGICLPDILVST